tara:strand:+ start:1280 stop:1657 length:378 start_codon:yes stop_codon:yes gene_type:complete
MESTAPHYPERVTLSAELAADLGAHVPRRFRAERARWMLAASRLSTGSPLSPAAVHFGVTAEPYLRRRVRTERNPDEVDVDPMADPWYAEGVTVPCVICGMRPQRGGLGACSTGCLEAINDLAAS